MPQNVYLPPYAPRRLIVHQHMMKCAGTTIVGILERELGDAFYHVHRDDPRGVIFPEQLAAFLEATPALRAMTTHHLRGGAPEGDFEVIDCAPLRDPLDRLASLYHFTRNDPSQLLHPFTLRGLEAFFLNALEHYPDVVINVQTSLLATRTAARPAGRRDLERAIARMRASSFVAVVDRFDESMVVAEYFVRPSWPGLQLHYRPANTTRELSYDLAERERRLRAELGEPTYALLKRLCELDAELVAAAREELDRRIALIPGFELRLQAFRHRCAALAETQPA
ncbi:MAG TPA: hypothetical protein VHS78_07970 [Candidatus Elarobacter sp.]|nr:hypothetical protein [Candidatus Elarobacter sp.]